MQKPFSFVLFGATGDLAQRKILPALFQLFKQQKLSESNQIICFSRRPWNDAQYRAFIAPALNGAQVEKFLELVSYVEGTFDNKKSFENLKAQIKNETVFYHLAIQPEFYTAAIESLGQTGHRGKLLIEKPFGSDLDSALALEKHIENYFAADSILLIDHYLGKMGLQALYERRKNDPLLEQKLSNKCVQSIQVRLLEAIDIQGREEFYDAVGALRDVGQNHILIMLALFLADIEKPVSFARAAALSQLNHILRENSSRGQYDGYRAEVTDQNSEAETYFKLKTSSRDKRWQGVEIILEGGKALAEKKSDIIVILKDGSEIIFDMEKPKNRDAYEIILEAALLENRDFFVSFSEMKIAWKLISPIRTLFPQIPLKIYKKGTNV